MAEAKQAESKNISTFYTRLFVAAFALAECLTHFGSIQGDSPGYIDMVKLFRGTATTQEALVLTWHGMLRPVVPMLAVPVSFFTSYATAIAVVSTEFVILGALTTYQFGTKLLGDEVGLVSAVGFASASPVLGYGAAVLTDGPGYAMMVILLYAIVILLPERKDLKFALLTGVLVGLGILTKETTVVVLLFLILYYLMNRDKIAAFSVLAILILGGAIPLIWAHIIGQSYLGFYGQGLAYTGAGYDGPLLHPRLFMLSGVLAYTLLLPFAFMAFFTLVDKNIFKILFMILISTGLLVLCWPTLPETRFTFLTFPAVIPFAALGITQASEILAGRPFLDVFSKKQWLILILIAVVAATNASRGYLRLV